jgi:hypothetical protein
MYHMKILDDFCGGKYHFVKTKNEDQVLLKLKLMLYIYNLGEKLS